MTAEVHELKLHRVASAAAIEKLEEVLEEVKRGEVTAVAIVTLRFDGSANSCFTPADNGVTMLGAIDLLRLRYARDLLSESGE